MPCGSARKPLRTVPCRSRPRTNVSYFNCRCTVGTTTVTKCHALVCNAPHCKGEARRRRMFKVTAVSLHAFNTLCPSTFNALCPSACDELSPPTFCPCAFCAYSLRIRSHLASVERIPALHVRAVRAGPARLEVLHLRNRRREPRNQRPAQRNHRHAITDTQEIIDTKQQSPYNPRI